MQTIVRSVLSFRRDCRGATATVFAVAILPIAASIGVAVDGTRWFQARKQTSIAVDSAVLAGARHMQQNPSDESGALATAMRHYKANTLSRSGLSHDSVTFALSDNQTTIASSGDVAIKTSFLAIAGIATLSVYAPAKATFLSGLNASTDLEVSLVLDFTGSMCDGGAATCSSGTKISGLRDAATELVDIVVNADQSHYKSRVALVPFSDRIRVARDGEGASLMAQLTDLPATWSGYMMNCTAWNSSGGGETATTGGCTAFGAPTYVSNQVIMPCVTDRLYTSNWDENDVMDYTDNAPGPNRWLMAHGGDRAVRFYDSRDSNPMTSNTGATSADPSGQWNYHYSGACSDAPLENVVQPLSSDKAALKSAINGFTAGGGTAGPLATSFGWFMLSPKWEQIWPVASKPGPYTDLTAMNAAGAPKLRKVAIIMTDGVYNKMRGSHMSNTGKVADHAVEVCRGMKSAGVEVYTVGFALDLLSSSERGTAEDMLKACGSSVSHFYSTLSVDQLKTAFRDIALKVTPIRLIQ